MTLQIRPAPGTGLGWVLWYSIGVERVGRADIARHLTDLGLEWRSLPPAGDMVDAFKCATDTTLSVTCPGPESGVEARFRLVQAKNTDTVLVRQIERRYAKGTTLSDPVVVGSFSLRRKATRTEAKGAIRTELRRRLLPATEQAVLDGLVAEMDARYHAERWSLNTSNLRRMIRDLLGDAQAVLVGQRQAGLWFLPADAAPLLGKLQALITIIGGGSLLHAIPVPDTTDQRAMIASAADYQVDQICREITGTLTRIQGNGRIVKPFQWESCMHRWTTAAHLAARYTMLTGTRLPYTAARLEVVHATLADTPVSERRPAPAAIAR